MLRTLTITISGDDDSYSADVRYAFSPALTDDDDVCSGFSNTVAPFVELLGELARAHKAQHGNGNGRPAVPFDGTDNVYSLRARQP